MSVVASRVLKSGRADAVAAATPAAFGRAEPPPPPITEGDLARAYERGLAEGRTQAAVEHDAAVAALAAAVQTVTADARTSLVAAVEELRRQVVDLGMEIGRWIVTDAVERDPDLLRTRLHDALGHVTGEADLRVFVHPTHAARVSQWVPEGCAVLPDEDLGPADFLLRTNAGSIVGTLEDALERLGEAMAAGAAAEVDDA
jgi:flagellar biosynthesis/type III secretory pathway protein FliH